MLLMDHVDGFAEFLRDNVMPATRYSYTARVKTFLRAHPDAAAFTSAGLRAYITRMGDTHRPRTQCIHLASLRAFGDYLVREGHMPANPAAAVRAPKLDAPRRETPTDAQVAALVAATSRIYHPYRQALCYAVVRTLVYGALRRSECLGLRVEDIDLSDGAIYVRHGKGNKARTVRPGAPTMQAIADYLERRHRCETHPTPLWLLRRNKPMGDGGLRTLLREVTAIAGMAGQKILDPHCLRHACATRLLRNGADIRDIMEYLGHAEISTTALYLHSPTERMRYVATLTEIQTPGLIPPIGLGCPPMPAEGSPPPTSKPASSFLRLIDGAEKERPAG